MTVWDQGGRQRRYALRGPAQMRDSRSEEPWSLFIAAVVVPAVASGALWLFWLATLCLR